MEKKNPVTVARDRASDIKTLGRVDVSKPSDFHPKIQTEMLAVASVMRRFRVSFWHAKTICQLSGLGGAAS